MLGWAGENGSCVGVSGVVLGRYGLGWVKISWFVDTFKVRTRKRSAMIVGGETDVSGDGWVVSSCTELCMI